MKKFVTMALALVLGVTLTAGAIGCKKEGEAPKTEPPKTEPAPAK